MYSHHRRIVNPSSSSSSPSSSSSSHPQRRDGGLGGGGGGGGEPNTEDNPKMFMGAVGELEQKTKSFERYDSVEDQKTRPTGFTSVFSKIIDGMPAATMFTKFKSSATVPQNPVDTNPIIKYFEIGKQTASAGPELAWKIHDAYRKSDGKARFPIENFVGVLRKTV